MRLILPAGRNVSLSEFAALQQPSPWPLAARLLSPQALAPGILQGKSAIGSRPTTSNQSRIVDKWEVTSTLLPCNRSYSPKS